MESWKLKMEKHVTSSYFCCNREEEQDIAFTVKHLSNKIMSFPGSQTLSPWALVSSNLPRLDYEDTFLAWPMPPQNKKRGEKKV